MNIDAAKLENVHAAGTKTLARCPACAEAGSDESGEHLVIQACGRWGCIKYPGLEGAPHRKRIFALVGVKEATAPRKAGERGKIVKTYNYTDAAGKLLFQVCRFEPKDFRQRRPDLDKPGKWLWNMDGQERVLYRLPKVLEAKQAGKVIFAAEGEKDVEALEKLGLTATCNSGGAGKWKNSYSETLAKSQVIVIAHKDEAGRNHAQLVAGKLHEKVESIRVLELPDRDGQKVKDAADWISAGGTSEELMALVAAASAWEPPKPEAQVKASGDGTDQAETTEIQAEFWKLSQDANLDRAQRFKLMAGVVLDFLHRRGRFFFHADHKDFATAMFFDSRRKLLLQLASDEFQSWLSMYIGMNRTEPAFKFIFAALEDETLTGQTTGLQPEMFWAAQPGVIYLSNGDGQAVKITPGRVQLVENGTDDILFPAGFTLRPWTLTDPKDPVESCRLFNDIKATAQHAKDLLRLWLCSLPTNQRCKPPLTLAGEIGSGKTRLAVGLFELLGITPRVSAITKNGEDDFWTELNGGGLVCFDNADTRIDWLADSLAAAATDVNRTKRQLYTDNKLIQQRARAWVVITSSNPLFASDPGLADRILVIRLERRTQETAESALSDEIGRNRDTGLSWIAETLSKALAEKELVTGTLNRRHPDFATFAVKIGKAIGRESEAVQALLAAESDKSQFNLENDDFGATLLDFMATRPDGFTGTADSLRNTLKESGNGFDADFWTSKKIGRRIEKLWPHIESMFQAKKQKDTHTRLTEYQFAYSAYSQRPFWGKSLEREIYGENPKTALKTTHYTQNETFDRPTAAEIDKICDFFDGKMAGKV